MGKAATDANDAPRNAAPELEALIERWWEENFPGSPVARATEAWNHALSAKAELVRRLREFAGTY